MRCNIARTSVADEKSKGGNRDATETVVIKKYANRRLYNTRTSAYVTLEDLATMVREGVDFVVYDAKTNDDLTRQILTQIIFEEESRGEALLPVQFLRQLIGFYGGQMQGVLPSYLEMSLANFGKPAGAVRQPDEPRLRNRRGRQPDGGRGPRQHRHVRTRHADVPRFRLCARRTEASAEASNRNQRLRSRLRNDA